MGKVFWIALAVGSLAGQASARDVNPRIPLHCQYDSDVRECTAANGRIDAERVLARNKLAFYVFGGPAMPQEPLEIMDDEYKKAGFEVWWLGDLPQFDRDAYHNAFNKRMEEAFDARHGQGAMRKIYNRVDARIKAARARREAQAAAGEKR
jgi:hypothetical protein